MEPAKTSNRAKRPFSQVEKEEDEALPISKRINHLDINKGQRTSQEDEAPTLCTNVARVMPQQVAAGPVTPSSPLLVGPFTPSNALPAPVCMSFIPTRRHVDPQQPPVFHQQPFATPAPLLNCGQYHNGCSPGQWSQPTAYPHAAVTAGGVQHPFSASLGHGLSQDSEVFDDDEPMNLAEEVYDPELTERDNPHYYQINHVLFQMQCDRARRAGYTVTCGPPGSES